MPRFDRKIVLFGFGAVGRSALTVLEKEVSFDPARLLIIDRLPQPFELPYRYLRAELRPGGQESLFSPHLKAGDMLLDFSSETDCLETLKWCRQNGVMYLNTGDNEWPDKEWKNIYDHYQENERFFQNGRRDGATCIIHHGANPGSVSHFVKKGLADIVAEADCGAECSFDRRRAADLLKDGRWGELAELIGVKTIHSSDCDIQEFDPQTLRPGAFYSTWNPPTFFNESTALAEVRSGTFEPDLHPLAVKADRRDGWQELNRRGTECLADGWTPAGKYTGMIIGHEEIFSISDCLSVYKADGTLRYRPTVYFVYRASDAAMNALQNQANRGYTDQEDYQLIEKGITAGTEYVGVLIMGDRFKPRWVGNCLTLEHINKYFPGQTPTILQVAVPAVAAVSYMIRHPQIGICYPDELPYQPLLEVIEKYAGPTVSVIADINCRHDMSRDIYAAN